MERRFVLFMVLAMTILMGHALLQEYLYPRKPPKRKPVVVAKSDAGKNEPGKDGEKSPTDNSQTTQTEPNATEPKANESTKDPDVTTRSDNEAGVKPPNAEAVPEKPQRPVRVTLGSFASSSPYLIQATFNSQGAALECVELTERNASGELRFRVLENSHGYIGYLALTDDLDGCRINATGNATPATTATTSAAGFTNGLQPGDVIRQFSLGNVESAIQTVADFDRHLAKTKPGDTITLTIARAINGTVQTAAYSVKLDEHPLEIIRPELPEAERTTHPLSCLLSLASTESLGLTDGPEIVEVSRQLKTGVWDIVQDQAGDAASPAVEFHKTVEFTDVKHPTTKAKLEIVKRYRMHSTTGAGNRPPYHIDLELEFHNRGDKVQPIAYRLNGPNGLPTEGWWYLTKIHPQFFHSAGARDVMCKTSYARTLYGTSDLYNRASKTPKDPKTILFDASQPVEQRQVEFVGVDTQYFLAALRPKAAEGEKKGVVFANAAAEVLNFIPPKANRNRMRMSNVSFELVSEVASIEPNGKFAQNFELFAGPKHAEVLAAHGLGDTIEYGWFPWVVKPLSKVVHFFHGIVGNWGIAIIMLTLLVRGCMFPLSRKAAVNAAMMQQLSPELKKIADKYKDMNERAAAQRDLFKRHNYNPLSGCWMMFVQLPIFIGLYRSIAIDIDLRQAALFKGAEWCSNLAGPDTLFHWKGIIPSWFGDETGWLGPYFNVLPIITVSLFLLQQKLFTPPPTDEQTRMQASMMKYMTVFMGVMFYKVPAGLCIYFIMSSLWSVGERKLLPKPKPKPLDPAALTEPPSKGSPSKGAESGDTSSETGRPSILAQFENLLKKVDSMSDAKKTGGHRKKKNR